MQLHLGTIGSINEQNMDGGDLIAGLQVNKWINEVNEQDERWRSYREGLSEWMDKQANKVDEWSRSNHGD